MTAPETLTLPRSGVVLTKDPERDRYVFLADGRILLSIGPDPWDRRPDPDWCCSAPSRGRHRSREKAIAWADSRVLALRAALLPPDARERVERVIIEQFFVADGCGAALTEGEYHDVKIVTAAVLAALGAP